MWGMSVVSPELVVECTKFCPVVVHHLTVLYAPRSLLTKNVFISGSKISKLRHDCPTTQLLNIGMKKKEAASNSSDKNTLIKCFWWSAFAQIKLIKSQSPFSFPGCHKPTLCHAPSSQTEFQQSFPNQVGLGWERVVRDGLNQCLLMNHKVISHKVGKIRVITARCYKTDGHSMCCRCLISFSVLK